MTKIRVQVRNVYGNETIYPACKTSAFFAALAGTRTLTQDTLRLIRAQGIEIEVEAPRILNLMPKAEAMAVYRAGGQG